jgi:hypothetical protein
MPLFTMSGEKITDIASSSPDKDRVWKQIEECKRSSSLPKIEKSDPRVKMTIAVKSMKM